VNAELDAVGAVHVPGVLDATWIARLHRAIERCRATPGEHYGVLSQPGSPTVDSDLFRWFDDPDLHAVLHDSPLPALAADLLGVDEVVAVEDQWFASAPGATTASPWHQDDPYYNIDRGFLTVWVALDDAPAGAALRVVAGSHRWGRLFAPVEFAADRSTIGAAGDLERVPDVDAGSFDVRGWDCVAGDVIALHSRTLHAAGGEPIDGRPFRRLSTRWATADARYVDRGAHVASFWSTLPHGRVDGDLLACATFPLVRARGPPSCPSRPARSGRS
jgi:hypothetical protein